MPNETEFELPTENLEELRKLAIRQALRRENGNRTHAARRLGISVRTFQRALKVRRILAERQDDAHGAGENRV